MVRFTRTSSAFSDFDKTLEESDKHSNDGDNTPKTSLCGLYSSILFVFGSFMYLGSGLLGMVFGDDALPEQSLLVSVLEFVGAFVFFLSPPLDFCDGMIRAFDKEELKHVRPRWLTWIHWDSVSAVFFLLGGVAYMYGAAIDSLESLCDMGIIGTVNDTSNPHAACYVWLHYNESDVTWASESNAISDAIGGWVFFASSITGMLGVWTSMSRDEGTEFERAKWCCCCSRRRCGDLYFSWRDMDWLFYASILFMVVGLSEVTNATPFAYNEYQNLVNSVMWLVDAILFLIDWYSWEDVKCCKPRERLSSQFSRKSRHESSLQFLLDEGALDGVAYNPIQIDDDSDKEYGNLSQKDRNLSLIMEQDDDDSPGKTDLNREQSFSFKISESIARLETDHMAKRNSPLPLN